MSALEFAWLTVRLSALPPLHKRLSTSPSGCVDSPFKEKKKRPPSTWVVGGRSAPPLLRMVSSLKRPPLLHERDALSSRSSPAKREYIGMGLEEERQLLVTQ